MSESFIPDERKAAFATFIEGINRLSTNARFQEVLFEFDTRAEEAARFAMADPAGYLKLRGIDVPEGLGYRSSGASARRLAAAAVLHLLGILLPPVECWEFCYCGELERA